MHKLVGLQLFWSGTPTFSSRTPTFCQMRVLNSCFQNPSESSARDVHPFKIDYRGLKRQHKQKSLAVQGILYQVQECSVRALDPMFDRQDQGQEFH